jgi:hypothetical protein
MNRDMDLRAEGLKRASLRSAEAVAAINRPLQRLRRRTWDTVFILFISIIRTLQRGYDLRTSPGRISSRLRLEGFVHDEQEALVFAQFASDADAQRLWCIW